MIIDPHSDYAIAIRSKINSELVFRPYPAAHVLPGMRLQQLHYRLLAFVLAQKVQCWVLQALGGLFRGRNLQPHSGVGLAPGPEQVDVVAQGYL